MSVIGQAISGLFSGPGPPPPPPPTPMPPPTPATPAVQAAGQQATAAAAAAQGAGFEGTQKSASPTFGAPKPSTTAGAATLGG